MNPAAMSFATMAASVVVQTPFAVGLAGHWTLLGPAAAHGAVVQAVGGGALQTPAWQVWLAAVLQTVPQVPQLSLSVWRFVQARPPSVLQLFGVKPPQVPTPDSQRIVSEMLVFATPAQTWPTVPPSAEVPLRPTVSVSVQFVASAVPHAKVAFGEVGFVMIGVPVPHVADQRSVWVPPEPAATP